MASSSVLTLAWRRYLQQLDQQPLKTKAITAGVLAGLSDVLAQWLGGGAPGQLNYRRTAAVALWGLVWAGPSSHCWQAALERLFPNKRDPARTLLFMSFMSVVVEGRSWAATRHKLARDFWGVQQRGWRVWPLASWINQACVPLNLRVLWLNLVALGWTTFLIASSRSAPALARAAPKLARA